MSNIFQKVGNCKIEAKFSESSPFKYGVKAVGKKDISNKNKEALKNLSKVDKDLRDDSYYNKVKELSGADVVMDSGVAKKRKCKKRSPYKKKRLKGESDLDYNRRVHGVNRGSRPSNYQGPRTEQVGETVKGSVQKLV